MKSTVAMGTVLRWTLRVFYVVDDIFV